MVNKWRMKNIMSVINETSLTFKKIGLLCVFTAHAFNLIKECRMKKVLSRQVSSSYCTIIMAYDR